MKKKQNFSIFPFLIMGIFLVFASSCEKDDDDNGNGNDAGIPVLSTTEVTDITQTTAKSGGNITSDGGNTITARGVCWSTGQTPTISDNKTTDGTGAGEFSSILSGLSPNTTYYVRAYATNSSGTGYGSAMSFTTLEGNSTGDIVFNPNITYGTMTDIDGNTYKTVTIGTQTWMAENLAYAPSSGNYWAYDNDDANVEIYGYLYDWETALDVCPAGWHLPSDEEWTELTDYLGGGSVAGGKLKENGTTHWVSPNQGATNETGFTALPGGARGSSGTLYNIGGYGFWWSATEYNASFAWYRNVYDGGSGVGRDFSSKEFGFSVRCVRD